MSEAPGLGNCSSFVEGISTAEAMENPELLDAQIEVTWLYTSNSNIYI